jgi:DNA-binding NarL/FixJ family response regulator
MLRVLIADDHLMVRAGVEAFIEVEPRMMVAGSVGTVADAEAACRRLEPDVLVSDYHMPDGDGLTLCARLNEAGGPPVVLFSAFADDALVVVAAVAGAMAVVSKSADPDDLIAAIDDAARGRRGRPWATPEALRAAGRRLDAQDLPVLGMVMHGLEPDDIARTLGIDRRELAERRLRMLERLQEHLPGNGHGHLVGTVQLPPH